MTHSEKQKTRAARWGRWVIRWRWPVILATLLVVAGLAAGLPRLGFTDDYRVFFSGDNPQLRAFEELQNVYTKNDNILFVLAPADGDAFSAETLAAVEELTAEGWKVPFALRVDSVTNFQHTRAEGDDLIVEDLVQGALQLSDAKRAEARRIALAEPLLARRLVSESAHVTGVNVTLQLPGEATDEGARAVAAARELARTVEAEHPHLKVYLSGFAMLNNAFQEAAMGDMATLVPLMYLVIIVFLFILFRSFWSTLAAVVVITLSTVAAMGAAGWMGIRLSPPSAIAPTVVLTLAVADSVHLLMSMLVELRRGTKRREAIIEAVRINLWPVFLTSISTAIGFFSLNASDVPPLRDLGNMTVVGVTAAFGLSVALLPALVSLMPLRERKTATATDEAPVFDWLASLVIRRRRPLLVGSLLVVIAVATLIPLNTLNDQFVGYFDERVTFRQDTDFLTENLTGIYQMEFSLGAGESGGISEPAYLEKIAEFAAWWREQPEVVHVSTLSDTLQRLNMNMHADDPAWFRLPDNRQLAAQYLLLYEMSLPYGLDLNNQIDVDKSATRFTVTVGDLSTDELLAVSARGEEWLRRNAPPEMFAHAAGPAIMFAHIATRNIRSMLGGTVAALLLISVLLVFALRSWRYGVLSLVPNLAPAAVGFGLWGLLVGQVGFGLAVVVAMTLGIVVDDTVHFLSKYLRGRRENGLDPAAAIRYAFRSVGKALWVTTAVLVAGFLVLAFSTFAMNADMGQLTALILALALVLDFVLLPSLILELAAWRGRLAVPTAVEEAGVATAPVRES